MPREPKPEMSPRERIEEQLRRHPRLADRQIAQLAAVDDDEPGQAVVAAVRADLQPELDELLARGRGGRGGPRR